MAYLFNHSGRKSEAQQLPLDTALVLTAAFCAALKKDFTDELFLIRHSSNPYNHP